MLHNRLILLVATLLMAGFAALLPPQTASAHARSDEAQTAPSDTLRIAGMVEDVLIAALPDSVAGQAVHHYEPVRIPAMGMLREHSFLWKTVEMEAGTYPIRLRVHLQNGPPRPLILLITLR